MYENDRSQSPVEDMMQQEQTQNQRSVSRSRSRSPVRRSSRSNSRSRSPRRDERHRDRARRINLISKRIIISNIPYEMKWQDIKDIFRKEVGDVTYVELFENTTGKSKGQGVIEFKDKDTARKAIENMHRYKIKDRNIVVREERESDRNMIGRGVMGSGPAGGGGGGMGMGGGMMGNVGGLSPQVLSQLGIDGPLTNTVFVSNLDYKITWKKLKDVFRLAGNVTRAEIKEDKDGKSRGMGTVTFETNFEAVQAVSMFNGQSLYDRSMRVKMDSLGADKSSSAMPLPSGLRSIGAGLGPGGTPLQNQTNMGFSGSQGMGMSGMGGGMGSMGNMGGNSMGGMGMDSMGMGNMGMSNMGTGMGSNSMGGMGMNNMGGSGNYGGSGGMGMNSMGNTGMGMGNMSGMSDSYNSMGSSGFSSGMSGGMGDGMRGMSSNNMTSAYSTGISDMGSMGNSGYGGGSRSGSNYGMSSSSYSSSSRNDRDNRDSGRSGTRPDNCTVVCKNLPWKVTWQDLKEKFRAVGDVKFAEIKMENGKSQGWGLVRFGNAEDAQQAISLMNRTRLDGREIDVKLYR